MIVNVIAIGHITSQLPSDLFFSHLSVAMFLAYL